MKQMRGGTGTDELMFKTMAMAIILEPVKFIVKFFLMASNDEPRPCRPPLALDLGNDKESPIVVATQWLSFLASEFSNHARPRLIWQTAGATTW